MRKKLCLLSPAETPAGTTIVIRPANQSEYTTERPRVSIFEYPGWQILDEDPVPFTIVSALPYCTLKDSTARVLTAGFTDSTLQLTVTSPWPEDSQDEHLIIYTRPPNLRHHKWSPAVGLEAAGDIDADGKLEALVATTEVVAPRLLACVELEPLRLDWILNTPSAILDVSPKVIRAGDANWIVFTTMNPDNGIQDSMFTDRYGYFVVTDAWGNIITKKIMSCSYRQHLRFEVLGDAGPVIVAHSGLPAGEVDCDTSVSNRYYLSLVDIEGGILQTARLRGTPLRVWTDDYGQDRQRAIYVSMTNDSLAIFNSSLEIIKTKQWKQQGRYLGRFSVPGYSNGAVAFSTGLFNSDLSERILSFPFLADYCLPLKMDSGGHAVEVVTGDMRQWYAGRIRQKSALELASVFYHRNQEYVLMLLSGLFVGLVVVNVYRRKTKSNLKLIARQKDELEKTHQELKQAQQKLIAAEKYKQAKDIAGGFAHEIRNALFPADSLLTKMSLKSSSANGYDETTKEYHRNIKQAVGRAIDITELISKYTKLESRFSPVPCDLKALLEEAAASASMELQGKNPTLHLNWDGTRQIVCDPELLPVALSNLISNARDALKDSPSPVVTVNATTRSGGVHLQVRDNGPGIPQEIRERVMDPFFSTKPTRGTGLGLSITKRIAEMHNGTLTLTSGGEGTTATLTIPQPISIPRTD